MAGIIDVLGDRTVVVRAEPGLHRGERLLRKKGKEDEVPRIGDRVAPRRRSGWTDRVDV
jgi:hypothetical protein